MPNILVVFSAIVDTEHVRNKMPGHKLTANAAGLKLLVIA